MALELSTILLIGFGLLLFVGIIILVVYLRKGSSNSSDEINVINIPKKGYTDINTPMPMSTPTSSAPELISLKPKVLQVSELGTNTKFETYGMTPVPKKPIYQNEW